MPGDKSETPVGKFIYFDDHYNDGWLNTCTYDASVFAADGYAANRARELAATSEKRREDIAAGLGESRRDCRFFPVAGGRMYVAGSQMVYALDKSAKVLWKRPVQWFAQDFLELTNGDMAFVEMTKGAGGTLWVLTGEGKDRWSRPVGQVLGCDTADRILVRPPGDTGGPERSIKLYDRDGKLLFERSGQAPLELDDKGQFVIPKMD